MLNSVVRLWGDWPTFIAVLGGQTFSIFAGIYPYLFHKTMLALPMGGGDAKFNPDPTDTGASIHRSALLIGYTFIYFIMFLAS